MKKVHNLIILDQSGSMEIIRKQALSGLNETLQTIVNAQKKHEELEQRVTVLFFSGADVKYVYLNEKSGGISPISFQDYCPHGGTPLYDAIGKGISDIRSTFRKGETAIVTIITDGEENMSREFSLKQITSLIDSLKGKGWIFSFIGTDNLDVEGMAEKIHIRNRMSFTQDDEGTAGMWVRESKSRSRVYESMAMGCPLSEDDYFDTPTEEGGEDGV